MASLAMCLSYIPNVKIFDHNSKLSIIDSLKYNSVEIAFVCKEAAFHKRTQIRCRKSLVSLPAVAKNQEITSVFCRWIILSFNNFRKLDPALSYSSRAVKHNGPVALFYLVEGERRIGIADEIGLMRRVPG